MNTKKPVKAKVTSVVRESHRKAAEAFLDSVTGTFRRSALSKVLYPLTTPRSHPVSDQMADAVMRELSKSGRIQRHGHLHWISVLKERTLCSGRAVPELVEAVTLPLTTRCPSKWLSVDLETGAVFAGDVSGWRKATPAERKEAAAVL